MSGELSKRDLGEIRVRDGAVLIYRDKFGGPWVGHKEGRLHGQHAIMDRRRLLAHVDHLVAERERLACRVAEDPVITDGAAGRTIEDCAKSQFLPAKYGESGWVIEAPPRPGQTIGTQYLFVQTGNVSVQWTEDPREALRFAREDDVRAFMAMSTLSVLLIRPKFFEWEALC